jgi:hypothetical protein
LDPLERRPRQHLWQLAAKNTWQDFNFVISRSHIVLLGYGIGGHMDIQLGGLGVLKNLALTGIVNSDGMMIVS